MSSAEIYICICRVFDSRVMDSGTEGSGSRVQIAVATLSSNSLRQTVFTQAAKLVAALLRVARVTAGLAEWWQPTAGFMTHVTCRLTAKNRDQLRNPTLGNRVPATFTFVSLYQLYYFSALWLLIILPFWYRLTQVVLEKRPLNGSIN